MIQLLLELTVVVFFVITVFVSSIAVPVFVLTARGRWKWLAVFLPITFGWIWVMPAPLTSAEIWWNQYWWHVGVLFYQLIGLTLGLLLRRQGAVTSVLFAPVSFGMLWVAVATGGVLVLAPHYLGQDVLGFMQAQMTQAIQQTMALAKDVSTDDQRLLQEWGTEALSRSMLLLPAMVWLLGILVTSLTLFLGKWFVPRDLWMKYQGGLTRWKAGGLCVWLLIFMVALFLVNAYGTPLHRWMAVVGNGILGLAGVFLLQGVMIATYYIRRQREGIFRWMWITLIALFLQTSVVVMIILGVFDYWADFRRVDRKILLR